jgi:acyl carrier protein
MSIQQRLFELCHKSFKVPMDKINLNSSFQDDLGLDSLDLVEFALAVEDEFNINVPDKEITDIKTIGDVVRLIEKNQ